MYQFAIKRIVSKLAIKPVYTILNSCNFAIHRTDMYLTIQIYYNTVVYLTLTFHPKGESTALMPLLAIDHPVCSGHIGIHSA
jgi:hypothetical protein